MRRIHRILLLAGLVTAPGAPSAARAQSADTLLSRATVALNDLNYERALFLARQLLTVPTLTSAQRTAALQLVAAAFYPEEEDKRHADSAMVALRQLVRGDADVSMPRDITWRGLDSLLAIARTTTFVTTVTPEREYALTGPAARAVIRVSANRPASYRMTLLQATGAEVMRDSAGPATSAQLGIAGMRAGKPALESGAYTLVVSATDSASGETLESRYAVRVEAPALVLEPGPGAFDQSTLRPERFPPARSRAYTAAVLLAGATIGMAVAGRAEEPVRSAFSLDAKAIAAAVGLAGGAFWAARMDKGGPLPENVTYNQTLRRDHEARVASANEENQRRINAYRLTIGITPEER
jgi:hypothetical protein